jgi:hypothetical protein
VTLPIEAQKRHERAYRDDYRLFATRWRARDWDSLSELIIDTDADQVGIEFDGGWNSR